MNEHAYGNGGKRAAGIGGAVMTITVACTVFAIGMTATHWTAVTSRIGAVPTIAQMSQTLRNFAYYRDCASVRAAGVAPIRRGEPGYRPALDVNNNGLACEPYIEW